MQTQREYEISTDTHRLNVEVIHNFLAECHVLRDALVDLNDAGISVNYFLLFGLPVFIRTAN